MSERIVFKRCNPVLILPDGKATRLARADPRPFNFRGDARASNRPTCRFAVGVSFPSARAVSAGALVICIQSCTHKQQRSTKEIIAKGTKSYLAEIICFHRTPGIAAVAAARNVQHMYNVSCIMFYGGGNVTKYKRHSLK